jgi:hypothetical protein
VPPPPSLQALLFPRCWSDSADAGLGSSKTPRGTAEA